MERVCSKISEHPLLGTCLGTLQMFWNNQHAKASTEILPPSPEQKERGRCRDDWLVYQHHSDSLWAKSQCFGIVCIKSMCNSGISCCCTQENALQKWSRKICCQGQIFLSIDCKQYRNRYVTLTSSLTDLFTGHLPKICFTIIESSGQIFHKCWSLCTLFLEFSFLGSVKLGGRLCDKQLEKLLILTWRKERQEIKLPWYLTQSLTTRHELILKDLAYL